MMMRLESEARNLRKFIMVPTTIGESCMKPAHHSNRLVGVQNGLHMHEDEAVLSFVRASTITNSG